MVSLTPSKRSRQIRRLNFRLIESELYNYESTKRDLAQDVKEGDEVAYYSRQYLNPDIDNIEASLPVGNRSDPTAQKADELSRWRYATAKQWREVIRRLEAIEWMLRQLERDPEPKKLELVQLKYFRQKLTDQGIAQHLHISERTFRRWRSDAIRLVAQRLGWDV